MESWEIRFSLRPVLALTSTMNSREAGPGTGRGRFQALGSRQHETESERRETREVGPILAFCLEQSASLSREQGGHVQQEARHCCWAEEATAWARAAGQRALAEQEGREQGAARTRGEATCDAPWQRSGCLAGPLGWTKDRLQPTLEEQDF